MTAHTARRMLHSVLDGRALNRRQQRALYNPDPELNSLAEHVVTLNAYGVPAAAIRALLHQVRGLLRLNAQEGDLENAVAGQLDELAASLHDNECNNQLHQALGYRDIARRLRGPLARLDVAESITYFTAAAAIKDVLRDTTPGQLRSKSLRHELGAGPHDRLLDLLAVHEEARTA